MANERQLPLRPWKEQKKDEIDRTPYGGYDPNCKECQQVKQIGGPSHNGSATCRSHSIASGGYRAHCTCDTCY